MLGKSFFAVYLTDKERNRRDELNSIIKRTKDGQTHDETEAELNKLETKAIKAYIENHPTPEAIIDELRDIFALLDKEDFIENCKRADVIAKRLKQYERPGGINPISTFVTFFENLSKENYDNFVYFVMDTFCMPRIAAIAVLTGHEDYNDTKILELVPDKYAKEISLMITARYSMFYPDATDIPGSSDGEKAPKIKQPPAPILTEDYMKVFHDKTRGIAMASRKKVTYNQVTRAGTIVTKDMEIELAQYEKGTSLGVQEDKLLEIAKALFTQANSSGTAADKITDKVYIPLKEYALKCGYKVEPVLTGNETPEEEQKEINRAKNAMKDARKKIKKSLNVLFSLSVSLTEKVRGTEDKWSKRRLISGVDMTADHIIITFAQDYAAALTRLPLSNFSTAMLGIDARDTNAYMLGKRLIDHFSQYNNSFCT